MKTSVLEKNSESVLDTHTSRDVVRLPIKGLPMSPVDAQQSDANVHTGIGDGLSFKIQRLSHRLLPIGFFVSGILMMISLIHFGV